MTIKIDTTNYQRNFNRQPKANDYGMWIFNLGRQGPWTEFSWSGTYGAAAKCAKAEAKQLGCTMIRIAP